jgi:hypothetical protein
MQTDLFYAGKQEILTTLSGETLLYCIYFGPRNPEDIGQVNVQQYKPQNN